jgi:hypothetical protein
MPERVDYDPIAAPYNRRFANLSRSGILLSLLELIQTYGARSAYWKSAAVLATGWQDG